MVEILKENILLHADIGDLVPQIALVREKLTDLEADLRVFIGIEGSDARLGGAKGLSAQTLLLALIKQDMIGHHHLRAVRHQDLRRRNALIHNALNLPEQNRNIQRHAVSDNAGGVVVEHAGRQCVQRKLSVVIYDGVACVGSALKPDDNIGLLGEHIRNLAFSLISPVCSYDCFYHNL